MSDGGATSREGDSTEGERKGEEEVPRAFHGEEGREESAPT